MLLFRNPEEYKDLALPCKTVMERQERERSRNSANTASEAEMAKRPESSPLILFYCKKMHNRQAVAAAQLMDGFPCVRPAPGCCLGDQTPDNRERKLKASALPDSLVTAA